jgi:ATP/ADP translocase
LPYSEVSDRFHLTSPVPFLSLQLGFANALQNLFATLTGLKDQGGVPLDPVRDEAGYSIVLPIYVFGLISIICAKSFKYAFYEPTKEMAYIPLDAEIRGQAKAAVDVVAARFGKSGSSMIFIALNAISAFDNNSLNYVHIILVMFCIIMSAWIYSTIKLGVQFDAKTRPDEEVDMVGGKGEEEESGMKKWEENKA